MHSYPLPRLYLILLFAINAQSELVGKDEVERAVIAFTDKFSAIMAPTLDMAANLGVLEANVAAVLKMGGPVATVMALAMQAALKPQSPEFQAMELLRNSMETRMNDLKETLQAIANNGYYRGLIKEYDQTVSYKLNALSYYYVNSLQPYPNSYGRLFNGSCDSVEYSPFAVLNSIKQLVVRNCMPKFNAELVEEIREIIIEAEQKFVPKERGFWKLKEVFMGGIANYDDEMLKQLRQDLVITIQLFSGNETADPLTRALRVHLKDSDTGCLLRSVVVAKHYRRSKLEGLIESIKDNVFLSLIFGVFCEKLSSPEEPIEMRAAVKQANEIFAFIHNFAPTLLAGFWPAGALNKAQEYLKPANSHEQVKIDTTAVKDELRMYGEIGYDYFVLATFALEPADKKWFIMGGNDANRVVIQTYDGMKTRIVIRRVREAEWGLKYTAAKKWRKFYAGKIEDVLSKLKHERMAEVVDELVSVIGPLNKYYTTIIFFREYVISGSVEMDHSVAGPSKGAYSSECFYYNAYFALWRDNQKTCVVFFL